MNHGNVISVDDIDDPRLAAYVDLRHAKAGQRRATFIAEGRLVVRRLIASRYAVASILVQRGNEAEFAAEVQGDVPIYSLSPSAIRDLLGFDFHRGVMACGVRQPAISMDDFVADAAGNIILAALGISEAENLGSMLRSAAAFGVDQVLLGPRTIDPFARRTIRVSMATALKHHFYDLSDPAAQLEALARGGVRTVATTLDQDATPLNRFRRDDRPTVLMLGNEAAGLDVSVQAAATDRVRIPMQLGTDSLNVAVAAAVFLYELTQRGID